MKSLGLIALATVLTLFVVPVFYLVFDWLARKLTGHSSARGLRRAKEVEAEAGTGGAWGTGEGPH